MKRGNIVRDFVFGIVIIVLSLLILFYFIPNYITMPAKIDDLSPAAYPRVCGYLLLIAGTAQVVSAVFRDARVIFYCREEIAKKWKGSKQIRKNVLLSMVIVLTYYFLILAVRNALHISGFYIVTPICMIVLGIWLNWKNIFVLIAAAIATTASIYYIFWVMLNIRIP